MKAKVIFEFEISDMNSYFDPDEGLCKENLIELFKNMVHERLEMKSLHLSQNDPPNKDFLKAIEEDIALSKRIMKSIKYIGISDD